MHDIDVGGQLEQFGRKVREPSGARGRTSDLSRARFREGNERFQTGCRQGWVHNRHIGNHREAGDRREIGDRVEPCVGEQRRTDHDRARVPDQQRVAVRCRFRRGCAADRPRRAGPVIRDDGLAERLREPLRERAAENVIAYGAGDQRENQAHRA
jgi:hypothetical protein